MHITCQHSHATPLPPPHTGPSFDSTRPSKIFPYLIHHLLSCLVVTYFPNQRHICHHILPRILHHFVIFSTTTPHSLPRHNSNTTQGPCSSPILHHISYSPTFFFRIHILFSICLFSSSPYKILSLKVIVFSELATLDFVK